VAKSALIVLNDLLALKKSSQGAEKTPQGVSTSATGAAARREEQEESDSDASSGDESEYEGSISVQELMRNGYTLPSKEETLSTLSRQQKPTANPAPPRRKKGPVAPSPSPSSSEEDLVGEDGVVYPGMASLRAASPVITFADEDDFREETLQEEERDFASPPSSSSSSSLSSLSSSSSKPGSLVITEDGELVGGYHLDFNNLSPENSALLMGDAKRHMARLRLIREKEIAEHGAVDYELLDMGSDNEEVRAEHGELSRQVKEVLFSESETDEEVDDESEESLADLLKCVVPVSATTGAGIDGLWEDIRQCVISTVAHPPGWEERGELSVERRQELIRVVREHRLAPQERKRISETAAKAVARGGKEQRR
jgi:hypothetical protein